MARATVPVTWPVWRPFKFSMLLFVLMNLVPVGLAQVSDTWMRVGWIYYYYTIPLGLLLVAVGLIWSLRRRSEASDRSDNAS